MVKEKIVEKGKQAVKNLQLKTKDQFPLHTTLYSTIEDPQIVALICSGSGIEQRYYRYFAQYLSKNGIAAITWDARGIGKSLNGQRTSEVQTNYETWGNVDFETIIQFAKQRFKNARVSLIGHSFGGIYPFFAKSSSDLDAVVTIASINGNIKSLRRSSLAKLLVGMIRLNGHKVIPWRWIIGYDCPHGIIEQWAYWAMKDNYFMDHPDFAKQIAELDCPILNIGIGDDEIGNHSAAQKYHAFFHSTAIYKELIPADYGLNKIGHNGFFKNKNKEALIVEWQRIIQFLKGTI